jgi:hypothetical protein
MANRGQNRQPGSVRDIKEGSLAGKLDPPQDVQAPKWLSGPAKKEFKLLVSYLKDANVPIKQLDAYAIAMTAQCVTSVADWSVKEQAATSLDDQLACSQQVARFQRDSQQWLASICASPKSRVQIGLRSTDKKQGPLAKLLEQKQQNGS